MVAFRFMFKPANYQATIEYYRDVLGFDIADSWDNDGGGTLFRAGGGQVEVFGGTGPVTGRPAGVGMAIEITGDIDTLHDEMATRGAYVTAQPADQPWGHRSFAVRDPDGIPITFFREQT